ncbi:MAG: glutathione S-transferase family protein [Rickettsiales bacterium]|nr:glutathione S-transferase family protein [Rickettsiales bacterium]
MNIKYKLYQFPLCPYSRKVRLFLLEKNINVDVAVENFWEKRENFLAINPTGQIPVLLCYDGSNSVICDSTVICEFLEECHGGIKLIGDDPYSKAESKRINLWFDNKFFNEVTKHILYEKVIKYYQNQGSPNPLYLRASKINLSYHMDYIKYLLNTRKWLAGNKISLGDFSAASHLSVLDYLGHVSWDDYPIVKEWYMLIKSRPSFTKILQDNIVGFKPSFNYANLDF